FRAVEELSELCNRLGIPERALDTVNRDEHRLDLNLCLSRLNLLFLCKRWPEFLHHSRQLLSAEMYLITEMRDITTLVTHSISRLGLVKAAKTMRRQMSRHQSLVKLTGGARMSLE